MLVVFTHGMYFTARGVPNPQGRCRFSAGIGHDASKEPENRLSGINALPVGLLAERFAKAFGKDLFCVFRSRRRFWPWNRVRYLVYGSTQLPNVARVVADTKLVFG